MSEAISREVVTDHNSMPDGSVEPPRAPGDGRALALNRAFELLSELVTQAKLIAMLVNPSNPQSEGIVRDMQETGRVKGVQLHILKAGTDGEFETAFASIIQLQAGALLVSNDPFFFSQRDQLVALAARFAVPGDL